MEWGHHVCGVTQEDILKPSSEAQKSVWIKNRSAGDILWDIIFSAGPINKAIPSFTSSLTRVRERWWKYFKHLSLLKKGSQLRRFRRLE